MNQLLAYLWVALGGAIGSMARYGIGIATVRAWGPAFPWGTILINIVGSFIIAFFGALTVADGAMPASAGLRVFVLVGFCGGFTTFSSFSLQTLELIQNGRPGQALVNIVLSVVLCLAAAAAGYYLATRIGMSPRTEP